MTGKKLTRDEWITKFKAKHGDKFNYDEVPQTTNSRSNFTLTCPHHGPFKTSFMGLCLYDCPQCGRALAAKKVSQGRRTVEEALSDYTVNERDCWIWNGYKNKDGYGEVGYACKNWSTHRLSYMTYVGPIKTGNMVCHHCDTPACINPKHLYQGTALENNRDREARGRGGSKKYQETMAAKIGLSIQDIKDIFNSPQSTTTKVLSERYAVNTTTIGEIRRGRRYKKLV